MDPMGYYETYMSSRLRSAGYAVTFLVDKSVTINFLLTQLNSYDIVLWRTNTYTWNHVLYYYIGEVANAATQQKYASDFSAGWINANAGILGVTTNFISHHFSTGTLSHVKLMLLISSQSSDIGPMFVRAGTSSVIFCLGQINLGFGILDDLTSQLVSYLANGMNVYTSVFNTVNPYNNQGQLLRDPLDVNYSPPFWFAGSSTLTIK